jgi:hypothetical protein
MVDPRLMCDQHLLGEHVELHMFVGTLQKGVSVRGYLEGGLLEPRRMWDRHEELVAEMERRGMRHESPLSMVDVGDLAEGAVDAEGSLYELRRRCAACRARGLLGDQS